MPSPPCHDFYALVFIEEDEKFDVVEASRIKKFNPKHEQDFVKFGTYLCKEADSTKSFSVLLFELGDHVQMTNALNSMENLIISHALVDFTSRGEVSVIEIDCIKQFRCEKPAYKQYYSSAAFYDAKVDYKAENYEKARILAMGSYHEIMKEYKELKDHEEVLYALVRLLDDDTLLPMKIENITQYARQMPESSDDFEELQKYNGRSKTNEPYVDLQILKLGTYRTCSDYIDEYSKCSHALVKFVKETSTCIIEIGSIKAASVDKFGKIVRIQFKPDNYNDYDPKQLYVVKGKKNYRPIQIFDIGHLEVLKFKLSNPGKRFKPHKFNDSDIVDFCRDMTDDCSKSDNSSSSNEENSEEKIAKKKSMRGRSRVISSDHDSSDSEIGDNNNEKQTRQRSSSFDRRQLYRNNKLDIRTEMQNIHNGHPQNHEKGAPRQDDSPATSNGIPHSSFLALSTGKETEAETSSAAQATTKRRVCSKRARAPIAHNSTRTITKRQENARRRFNADFHGLDDQSKLYTIAESRYGDWSDSDIGELEDLKVFEVFYEKTEQEKEIKMIHLGWDEAITYKYWSEAKGQKNAVMFVKMISRGLYGRKIVEKCLAIKPNMKTVNGQPRTVVTDNEMKVFKQALRYWVLMDHPELLEKDRMSKILGSISGSLSVEISYQIKTYEPDTPAIE